MKHDNRGFEMREEMLSKAGSQILKADAGKLRISLVPTEIIRAIARVREYGVNKYGRKESWREVEPERYRDALLRHVLLWMEDPHGKDIESGLRHIEHIACNVAFLLELDRPQRLKGSEAEHEVR